MTEPSPHLSKTANAFLQYLIFSVSIFPPVVILSVSLIIPQIYNLDNGIHFSLTSGYSIRVLAFSESFIGVAPLLFSVGPTLTILTLSFFTLRAKVCYLNFVSEHYGLNFDLESRFNFFLFYRKLQLFTILMNEYVQPCLLPHFEFTGATGIILLSYLLLTLEGMVALKLLIILTLVCIVLILAFLFELVSKPYVMSRKVLHRARKVHWRKYLWSQRAFRSCQPIAIRIGSFHAIDRERAPLIMQFCLRRIFYLACGTD